MNWMRTMRKLLLDYRQRRTGPLPIDPALKEQEQVAQRVEERQGRIESLLYTRMTQDILSARQQYDDRQRG